MKQSPKPLLDALRTCQAVQRSAAGLTFEQFELNEEKQAAFDRCLILIGEALSQAAVLDPNLRQEVSELRQIIGMRHRLVHAYGQIDLEIVWDVIWQKIPPLLAALERLLAESEAT